jgi:hypothetical protein
MQDFFQLRHTGESDSAARSPLHPCRCPTTTASGQVSRQFRSRQHCGCIARYTPPPRGKPGGTQIRQPSTLPGGDHQRRAIQI